MPHAAPVGRFAVGAGLVLAAALLLQLSAVPVLAQGATGGSIGKQDKSVSGGQDGGARSTSREGERPSRSERSSKRGGAGGGVGQFDGRWASASFGRTCPDRTTAVVTIAGGQMTSDGFSGRVSSSGSVSGVWAGSGITASVSGRISGQRGAGSFRRSDGCVGGWTLVKQ